MTNDTGPPRRYPNGTRMDDYAHDMSLTGGALPELRRMDDGTFIETAGQWRAHREEIRRRILSVIGQFPPAPSDVHGERGETVETASYTRIAVSYAGEKGERIPAFLLVPNALDGPSAAVRCPHPTNVQGKQATAIPGAVDRIGYAYGHELAERGYVVLVPDQFTTPPRVPETEAYDTRAFEAAHPAWSPTGKMIWDHMRAMDFLLTCPEVDELRVGSIGFSLGGFVSLFAAAFDERIAAVVCASGVSPMRCDRDLHFSYVRKDFKFHYMPGLAPYLERGEPPPFEMHEVAALLAPRPLMAISGYHDQWCRGNASMGELAARVHDVYELNGRAEGFSHIHHGEGHAFGRVWREAAYAWLDRWLGCTPPESGRP